VNDFVRRADRTGALLPAWPEQPAAAVLSDAAAWLGRVAWRPELQFEEFHSRTARRQMVKLLPGDGRDERIARSARHLHNLPTLTLHELERLQARREVEAVPPPAVADMTVTVDGTG
jgi:hypothetical protein